LSNSLLDNLVLLDAGPDGFESGINTRKYMSLTKTSRTTAIGDWPRWLKMDAWFQWARAGGVAGILLRGRLG
jgi:hypothetical protein